jgi:hypothetical protein
VIAISNCTLTGLVLIVAGAGLNAWMGRLRNHPSRREAGTQHLVLIGMAGLVCAIAGFTTMVFVCD